MTFNPEQIEALKGPLLRDHVAQRKQAGRQLSYIEGWWAEAEANRIFGFHAWDSTTLELRMVAEAKRSIGDAGVPGWGVSYIAQVRVTVTTAGGALVIRDGVGSGHGIDRDLGLAHESAAKEAVTDAEKRALKTFGNPFGLALYDKTQANVVDAPREPAEPTRKDYSPAPMGDDWQGSEGAPGRSAYATKKDGGSERFKALQDEIATLDSMTAIGLFTKERTEEIKTFPEAWRKILREELEEAKRVLATAVPN